MSPSLASQRFYQIALSMLPSIGSVLAQNLLAYCGSCENVFKMSKSRLQRVPGIGEDRAARIVSSDVLKRAEKELKFLERENIVPLFFTDEAFPQRLKQCADMPLLLYYNGCADLNVTKVVSVIGTRKVSEYGKEQTLAIVKSLAAAQVLVVSGLAYGVDILAHKAALDCGLNTVGVLGHGLNQLYPGQHKSTATKMLEQGGLLTEFCTQDEFTPHNFPQRNRIVAGMCDAVIVVESAAAGGAMLTSRNAGSYHRDVFAVPGRITDKASAGCNLLIAQNEATIFTSVENFLAAMNWDGEERIIMPKGGQLPLIIEEPMASIVAVLRGKESVEIDVLAGTIGLSPSATATALLEMEMNNWIVALPGKRFRLIGG
ncbi:MAG: DNA-processing protein DprA [Chitinophagales bacterium]